MLIALAKVQTHILKYSRCATLMKIYNYARLVKDRRTII